MVITQIIGFVVFCLSFLLMLCVFIGGMSKRVGISWYGFSTALFFGLLTLAPYILQLALYYTWPDGWGVAYVFIVINLFSLLLFYTILLNATVLGKRHIFRVTYFLIPKKYSYRDVVRYRMKYEGGVLHTRFGPTRTCAYAIEIYFNDGTESCFGVNSENSRKVVYIKRTLENNRCKKNCKVSKT